MIELEKVPIHVSIVEPLKFPQSEKLAKSNMCMPSSHTCWNIMEFLIIIVGVIHLNINYVHTINFN